MFCSVFAVCSRCEIFFGKGGMRADNYTFTEGLFSSLMIFKPHYVFPTFIGGTDLTHFSRPCDISGFNISWPFVWEWGKENFLHGHMWERTVQCGCKVDPTIPNCVHFNDLGNKKYFFDLSKVMFSLKWLVFCSCTLL